MTIDKAIKELSVITPADIPFYTDDRWDALQLSIEALKLKEKLNSWSWHWHENLLPGETED